MFWSGFVIRICSKCDFSICFTCTNNALCVDLISGNTPIWSYDFMVSVILKKIDSECCYNWEVSSGSLPIKFGISDLLYLFYMRGGVHMELLHSASSCCQKSNTVLRKNGTQSRYVHSINFINDDHLFHS